MNVLEYRPQYLKLPDSVVKLKTFKEKNFVGIQELENFADKNKIVFPILTNEYFLSLINKDDKNDPLRALILPTIEELESYVDFQDAKKGFLDTSGEATNVKTPGLQHKYSPTALALVSNVCAGLCRECFRKRLFIEGKSVKNETTFPNEEALAYLKEHKEINAILLTGGDSLMLKDESISNILELLNEESLSHITTIRFGTKIQSFFPQRITKELCQLFVDFEKLSGKKVHICTHFEHANELSKESIASLGLTHSFGIAQYNQTVLLKGINDDVDVLYDLFQKLALHGVRPYYLFQCRPVIGSLPMQLTLKEGIFIYANLTKKMTGVHKPRYVMSTPIGKIEILGVHPSDKNIVLLKLHSSKTKESTGDILLYDVSKHNPCWYDMS